MIRLLALCWLATLAQSQPAPSPWVSVQGEYQNQAGYAFSVTIPKGLVGYRVAAPAPSHGVFLPLGSSANRLSVEGSYNALDHATPRAALGPIVKSIQQSAASWAEPRYQTTTLGGLPAMEVVMPYTERKTAAARILRSLTTLRRSLRPGTPELLYQITLDTAAVQTAQDTAVYDAIRKSFRLDPLTE